jgi:hypothetical protein
MLLPSSPYNVYEAISVLRRERRCIVKHGQRLMLKFHIDILKEVIKLNFVWF